VLGPHSEWLHSHFYPLVSGPVNPGSGRDSTIYWMLVQNLAPALQGFCHLVGPVTESSKDGATILSSQVLQDGGGHGKIVNFMSMDPLPHFICFELSHFIRSNGVWNTLTVNKAFSKSIAVVWAEVLHTRKVNPY